MSHYNNKRKSTVALSPSDSDYNKSEVHNQTTEIKTIKRKKVTLRERVSTQLDKLPTGANTVESEDSPQSQSDTEEENLSTKKLKEYSDTEHLSDT